MNAKQYGEHNNVTILIYLGTLINFHIYVYI